MSKWTHNLTVSFVPVSEKDEEAYWAAIRFFAQVILDNLLEDEKEVTNKNKVPSSCREDEGVLHEAA